MPNINDMLRELAERNGRLIYGEGDPPYPGIVIDSAVEMGLVRHYQSGGMQSTDVTIQLTNEGRERVGLKPRPWYAVLFGWPD